MPNFGLAFGLLIYKGSAEKRAHINHSENICLRIKTTFPSNRLLPVERLLRRLKGSRRKFTRFIRFGVLFVDFFNFALIIEARR